MKPAAKSIAPKSIALLKNCTATIVPKQLEADHQWKLRQLA
ncbi:hypothetical protein [Phormidesmis priestleyi]